MPSGSRRRPRRNDGRAQRSPPPPRRPERRQSPPPPPPPRGSDGPSWLHNVPRPPPTQNPFSLPHSDLPEGGRPDVPPEYSSPPPPPPPPTSSRGDTTSAALPLSLSALSSFIPAPQQTPATPRPIPDEFLKDLLNRAVAEQKLDKSKKSEDTHKAVKETSSSSMPKAQGSEESALNALEDLLDTTTLDESSSSMPKPKGSEESALNALEDLLDTTTLDVSSSSSSMPKPKEFKMLDLLALELDRTLLYSSCVSSLMPRGLLIKYFVRMDKQGLFHIYPNRGGPFQSLDEAQNAIDSHHRLHRLNICMDGLSDEERTVRYALYWHHNGTRKHSQEAFTACTTNLPTEELVKCLLDKHNEDNGLLEDLAYELQDVVSHNECFDGKDRSYRSYCHFNLTLKTKGTDANDLYFAEVTCMRSKYEAHVLTFLCVVKPNDNGECHVCGVDIKHPTHDGYNHGRPPKFRCHSHVEGVDLFEELFAVHDEAWLKAEEARLRSTIKEGMEERRKLEVEKKRDEHGKRGKYVAPAWRTVTS